MIMLSALHCVQNFEEQINDNDSNDDTDKTTKTVLMMSNTRRILMITMEAKVMSDSRRELLSSFISSPVSGMLQKLA